MTAAIALEAPLPVAGIRLGTARAGIRYPDRRDVVVLEIAPGGTCAAVFTRNVFRAAPVIVAQTHWGMTEPRYLVINTGNANAGTGSRGLEDARSTCRALADIAGCQSREVLPFSTGVIGESLPVERLIAGLPHALGGLKVDGWLEAAQGIMTTDTRPKIASRRLLIEGQTVTVTGMAKGAGMICPDMATMLAFVATDARMEKALLQHCLTEIMAESFNAITVDGDTSTNDACILLATGRGGDLTVDCPAAPGYSALREAIAGVCRELAQAIIRDGEGATKFVTVQVEQGEDTAECRRVAYAIAHSPLVKTAFFAGDPNWGRILAAVGHAGLENLNIEAIVIYLDEVCIVRNGSRAEHYTENQGRQVMEQRDITIRVKLGRGKAYARIWTTDLSFEYVRINAEYRT